MTKIYCHNGNCDPIHKKNGEDHSKVPSIVSFIEIILILFVITFLVAIIGGFLVKIVTL